MRTMALGNRERLRSDFGSFFLYLWVVRGHSVRYALELVRALLWRHLDKKVRSARNHFRDFHTHWWEFAEEDESFDLWKVVGVMA